MTFSVKGAVKPRDGGYSQGHDDVDTVYNPHVCDWCLLFAQQRYWYRTDPVLSVRLCLPAMNVEPYTNTL